MWWYKLKRDWLFWTQPYKLRKSQWAEMRGKHKVLKQWHDITKLVVTEHIKDIE